MADYVNITINDNPVQARVGETILHVCLDQGIEIPHLCHDPKLKPFAACYVCVVEIKGYKTHQPSCSTLVQEGMEIYTDTPEIIKSRKNALELLLSNHYADCVAPCTQACPAGVDIQGYLSLTEKGLFQQAVELIKETNPLPAICGRVCVRPCEDHCRRSLTEDNSPVGIDYLKRFIADFDLVSESPVTPKIKPLNGKKVAVIGSGPAGLTAAYYLQIEGIQADIYERASKTGGWLRYGIPEYRLPNAIIDREVANITKLGVKIFTQRELSTNLQIETLDREYDAIFLSIGAQIGDLLGIGEKSAPNLVSGIDFLKKNAETNNNIDLRGKKVVVIGGGNTAMDCCRTARRCGSEDVWVLYRRTEADMPASPTEVHESKVEGVQYQFLTAPVDVYYDEKGNLTGLKCIRMKAEKKEGSRRSTITPIEGSEFDVACDLVLPATGQKLESQVLEHINDYYKGESLRLNKWNTLDPDPNTLQMNISKIFAAGDVVTGPTNIIEAIAGGKRAAKAMTQYVLGEPLQVAPPQFISSKENFTKQVSEQYCGKYTPTTKNEMPVLSEKERDNFNEVELGYQTVEQVVSEVSRCLECGCSAFYDCDLQKYATQYGVDQTRFKGTYQTFETHSVHPKLVLDNHKCILCGRCVRVCNEYSGNRVWGFFKRGYKTYIAPNLEGNLLESRCDACGLCVDTCPTGALTENYIFKVLPVPYNHLPTIDPFGSEGFEVDLLEYKGNIYGATSRSGVVNHKGLINREIFFNYSTFNKSNRITQPMEKINGVWEPVSTERALERIKEEVQKVKSENNF
ncbi:MAG TPA: FAD-dependent oxidoreductase, partial [Bacteroidales bacterium]|nr:FAD-dependent oxidoreductase [Bacteroidales bacterium]